MSTIDTSESTTAVGFTAEQEAMIRNAPPHMLQQIYQLLQQGLSPDQLTNAVSELLARAQQQTVQVGFGSPVGNDAMVATPDGQGLSDQIGIAGQQAANGQTTISEKDVEMLKSRVESLVKEGIARGASDSEIQQTVGSLAGSPELASMAREMAQQQLDVEKFNLFNTRNGQETQSPDRFDVLNMGGTTAALAAAERGFVSGPGIIPDVRTPGLDRGFGLS